jgi:oligopeptide/dipeptide ABC transporter ATP-binding protein
MSQKTVLQVENLRMYYNTTEGDVRAVDGLNFDVAEGEVLGIVGESGCGKSSMAQTLMKLLPSNGKIKQGRVVVDGIDITNMHDGEIRRKIRWSKIAMIPQGAMNSLNPVFKVGDQISEVLRVHKGISKKEAMRNSKALLQLVGVDPRRAVYYPHEFSGGMKQRAMIAMSLALTPSVLIADEPTTALDVIVQAGIIRLLLALRKEFGMSIILITHDLALVAQMSDTIAIMYAGEFVEYGKAQQVYRTTFHPYTLGLLGAFADISGPKKKLISIPGSPPDLLNPPSGCRFNPRCPYAKDLCREKPPVLEDAGEGHLVACHFWKDIYEQRTEGPK